MSVILNLFLLRYGGTTAVAAYAVIMYADSISGMLLFGMCDALQPAISYCYGAAMTHRVRALFGRVLVAAVALSCLSMCLMLFAGRFIVPLFIKEHDTALLAVSVYAMHLFSFSYLTGWIDTCFSSLFTALERPVRSLLVALFGTVVFPIAFLFVLSALRGLNGIWLMPAVSGTASGILTLFLALSIKNIPDKAAP